MPKAIGETKKQSFERQVKCPCLCHDGWGGAHPNEVCACKAQPSKQVGS